MKGRYAEFLGEGNRSSGKRTLDILSVGSRPNQKAWPWNRRKRNRAQELRIVAAPGPLVGVGPSPVENILAPAVAFQIARHRAGDFSVGPFEDEVLWQPARSPVHGASLLQRVQEGMADERIEMCRIRIGARIPLGRVDLGHGGSDANNCGVSRCHRRSGSALADSISGCATSSMRSY